MRTIWLSIFLFHIVCLPGMAFAIQPNIVVILTDDLGWSDTGAYGNTFIDTPNIDQLARDGVRMTRFYADPVCSPSRAAIQTGLYAPRTGITDFISPQWMTHLGPNQKIRGHWRPFEKVYTPLTLNVLPDVPTIANLLSAAGYTTAYFGKWHLGFDAGFLPGDRGYVTSQVMEGHTSPEGEGSLAAISRGVDEFLGKQDDSPYFLFLSTTQPHIPLEGKPELVEKYTERASARRQDVPIPAYAAVVEELDTFVGDLRRKLDAQNSDRPTAIIFLSDNGGLENFDLDLGGRVTSNAPLRGEKGTIYEGGLRVPMIAVWTDVLPKNTVTSALGALYDIAPTLLDIAGVKSPGIQFDGQSLLTALTTGYAPVEQVRELYFHYPHYHHDRPASAVVSEDWKLIEFLDTEEVALYNVSADAHEENDLSAKYPDRAREMKAKLESWWSNVGARLPTQNPDYDPVRASEWWMPYQNKKIDADLLRKLFKVNPGQ